MRAEKSIVTGHLPVPILVANLLGDPTSFSALGAGGSSSRHVETVMLSQPEKEVQTNHWCRLSL